MLISGISSTVDKDLKSWFVKGIQKAIGYQSVMQDLSTE